MSLTNSRSHFSALTSTSSVCSTGPLPPHSCPTVDGDTCVFPFTNGWSMLGKCYHGILPPGSETYSSCVSEDDDQSFWCSTPAKRWAQCHSGNALLKEVTLHKFVKILYQISKINQSSIANMVFYAYSILQVNKYTLCLHSECLCLKPMLPF